MRDTSFSICKALAIILVVLSHSGAPGWVNNFIFQFHVPVFFICAGYFFHTRYLNDEKTYVLHRVEGLYFPFLRWSIIFLVLHNLFFPLGILSEQYGNAAGGVLHPYTWQIFNQRLWSIVFNMSGYDEFIGGTFWFFRALLLSSVAFLLLFKVLRKYRPDNSDAQVAWTIIGIALGMALWKVTCNLKITGVAQGGYREIMGVFFMAAGFLFRQYRERIPMNIWLATACLAVTVIGACYFPSSMIWSANFKQFVSLLLPSLAGFGVLYYLSCKLDTGVRFLKAGLVYIGDRTLYIFAFHLLAFKVVSAMKVGYYGLPWQEVGGHPVVNAHADDWFFLLYLLAGVGLPLLWLSVYRHLAKRIDFSLKSRALWLLNVLFLLMRFIFLGLKTVIKALWNTLLGIITGIKDIINASNPNDE